MTDKHDGAWFTAKRFGYGAGLPIAWQGWALLIGHMAVIVGGALLLPNETAQVIWVLAFAVLPMPLYAAKTRGGWRWRWNARD